MNKRLTHLWIADQLFQKLQQLDEFKASKNVSIYISMPACEIMTTSIIHHLLNSGMCIKYMTDLFAHTYILRQKLLHTSLHKKYNGYG